MSSDEQAFALIADGQAYGFAPAGPRRAPHIGFVDLNGDVGPAEGKTYSVLPASALKLADLPTPASPRMHVDLDLHAFYSGDLPDSRSSEGMLRIQVDTRSPQDLTAEATASFLTKFRAKDKEYVGGFHSRGVFRNVLVDQYINLRFALVEFDTDAAVYFDRILKVVKDSGLDEVDVIKGIPYLDVGTKLIESIVRNFGKNQDDELWTEVPILQIVPIPGSIFLRNGIYVIIDRPSRDAGFPASLTYRNGQLRFANGALETTHLVFGLGLRPAA